MSKKKTSKTKSEIICVDNSSSFSYRNFVLETIKNNMNGRKKEMSAHKIRKTFRACRNNKLQLKRLRDTLKKLLKSELIEKCEHKNQSYLLVTTNFAEKKKTKKNTSVKKKKTKKNTGVKKKKTKKTSAKKKYSLPKKKDHKKIKVLRQKGLIAKTKTKIRTHHHFQKINNLKVLLPQNIE